MVKTIKKDCISLVGGKLKIANIYNLNFMNLETEDLDNCNLEYYTNYSSNDVEIYDFKNTHFSGNLDKDKFITGIRLVIINDSITILNMFDIDVNVIEYYSMVVNKYGIDVNKLCNTKDKLYLKFGDRYQSNLVSNYDYGLFDQYCDLDLDFGVVQYIFKWQDRYVFLFDFKTETYEYTEGNIVCRLVLDVYDNKYYLLVFKTEDIKDKHNELLNDNELVNIISLDDILDKVALEDIFFDVSIDVHQYYVKIYTNDKRINEVIKI